MYKIRSSVFWFGRSFTARHAAWFPDWVVNWFIDREWRHVNWVD